MGRVQEFEDSIESFGISGRGARKKVFSVKEEDWEWDVVDFCIWV